MAVKFFRDSLTLCGLACIMAGAVVCPALCWWLGGLALVAGALAWQRYEGIKARRRP